MSERAPIGALRLWTGVVLAPLAWVCAEGIGYVVAAHTCEPPMPKAGRARVGDVAICTVCLVVAVFGLFAAIENARQSRGRTERAPTLLAFGGAFSSALFTAGIVLFALPAVMVNACNQVR